MNNLKIFFLITIIVIVSIGCGDDPPIYKNSLKIALSDSISLDDRKLPESIKELCAVLTSDKAGCKGTYILDPSLIRIDLNKEFSLRTEIKGGGAKRITSPKVIGKLIQKNLKDLDVPIEFTKPQEGNKSKLMSDFLAAKSSKDSLLVLDESGSLDSYVLNKKTYKVYSSIDDIRNRILTIICQNEKANFTLLINPPVASVPRPPAVPEEPLSHPDTDKPSPQSPIVGNTPKPHKHLGKGDSYTGDLTIVKGSEGCDICTRYYSATDNLGRTHDVREKNSTNCCPCGKTIEMQGRTYRMDCEGSPHLVLE